MALTNNEKFNLIKPLPKEWKKDNSGTPYLRKNDFSDVDWNTVKFTSYSNIKSVKDEENSIVLNFQYDKAINCIYNNIFVYARKVFNFLATTTPDYSAYTNMEPCKVEENVRHSLWVGAWLQHLGIKVIPTITWADKRTYDICFNYVEEGSVVAISTVGVSKYRKEFLEGFIEMKKRIKPSLILVRGKLIEGMEGKFIFIDFKETFNVQSNFEQLSLFEFDRVQSILKEDI